MPAAQKPSLKDALKYARSSFDPKLALTVSPWNFSAKGASAGPPMISTGCAPPVHAARAYDSSDAPGSMLAAATSPDPSEGGLPVAHAVFSVGVIEMADDQEELRAAGNTQAS